MHEMIICQFLHSQYNYGVPIQISVYEDKMYIANCGQLPDDWTAEKIGVSKKIIDEHINYLKEKGIIKRSGNNKKGYWKIKD